MTDGHRRGSTAGPNSMARISAAAIVVIAPMIGAAWLTPPSMPLLQRQILLSAWGVGATLFFQRRFFGGTVREAATAIGFADARLSALLVALLVSLPMWLFLPVLAWSKGVSLQLRAGWPLILAGVVMVNGIAEEVIHRGFVFGRLRAGRSFWQAAILSALIFAAQHLYLAATIGVTAGLASVVLAALLAFPLAYAFERGGNSIGAPAILHTSSNAPMMMLTASGDFMSGALLPHMTVVLASLYLVFVLLRERA